MKVQLILILCGIAIFIITSFFSAFIAYFYEINATLIFIALLIEAVIIFITTTYFLKKYHEYKISNIINLIKNDKLDGIQLERDKDLLNIKKIIDEIKKESKEQQNKEKEKIEDILILLRNIKSLIEERIVENEESKTVIISIKDYFYFDSKIFDKIKTIGLEIKNTSKNIDFETHNILNDTKKQLSLASNGVKAIGKGIQSINELKASIFSSTKIIEELIEMSKRINNFVTTIADFAKKTNHLALNAGIEAARAGEAGKSFSVVAEEIKQLATNSNKSAEEITQILKNIRERTAEVIEMIRITEKIEDNILTFYKTGDIFIDIVKDVKRIEKTVGNVSEYSNEHYIDSELLFKIITDTTKKLNEYIDKSTKLEFNLNTIFENTTMLQHKIGDAINKIEKILI